MKKQLKYLIITLIAVLVLGAGIWAVLTFTQAPAAEESSTPSQTVQLYQKDTAAAVKFEVKNHNDTYTVERRENGNFYIAALENYKVNESSVSSFANAFCGVKAKKLVTDNAEDLALYGLDDPYATVTAVFSDETIVLKLGNQEASTSAYYAQVDGSNAVYLLNPSIATRMVSTKLGYVSTTITGPYDATSGEELAFDYITLSGTVRQEPIEIRPTNTTGEYDVFGYEIIAPGTAPFDISGGNDFMTGLFNITANNAVELSPDEGTLAAYGFDNPYSVLDFKSSSGDYTITVGKVDGETAYIMNGVDDVIFEIPKSTIAGWLEVQYPDLVSKIFLVPHINTVREVEIATPDNTYVFGVSNDAENNVIVATYNGKPVVSDNFQTFYQVLVSAYLENYTTERSDAAPKLSITYRYNEGGEDTVAFITSPTDARQSLILLNGAYTDFSVRSIYVDKVIEDVYSVTVNETVDTTW